MSEQQQVKRKIFFPPSHQEQNHEKECNSDESTPSLPQWKRQKPVERRHTLSSLSFQPCHFQMLKSLYNNGDENDEIWDLISLFFEKQKELKQSHNESIFLNGVLEEAKSVAPSMDTATTTCTRAVKMEEEDTMFSPHSRSMTLSSHGFSSFPNDDSDDGDDDSKKQDPSWTFITKLLTKKAKVAEIKVRGETFPFTPLLRSVEDRLKKLKSELQTSTEKRRKQAKEYLERILHDNASLDKEEEDNTTTKEEEECKIAALTSKIKLWEHLAATLKRNIDGAVLR